MQFHFAKSFYNAVIPPSGLPRAGTDQTVQSTVGEGKGTLRPVVDGDKCVMVFQGFSMLDFVAFWPKVILSEPPASVAFIALRSNLMASQIESSAISVADDSQQSVAVIEHAHGPPGSTSALSTSPVFLWTDSEPGETGAVVPKPLVLASPIAESQEEGTCSTDPFILKPEDFVHAPPENSQSEVQPDSPKSLFSNATTLELPGNGLELEVVEDSQALSADTREVELEVVEESQQQSAMTTEADADPTDSLPDGLRVSKEYHAHNDKLYFTTINHNHYSKIKEEFHTNMVGVSIHVHHHHHHHSYEFPSPSAKKRRCD